MATKTTAKILETRFGSLYTMDKADARVAVLRLREFLDCDGVSIEKCTDIKGEHDWFIFKLAPRFHDQARAYLEGWKQGDRDGLDRHYGRTHHGTPAHALKQEDQP